MHINKISVILVFVLVLNLLSACTQIAEGEVLNMNSEQTHPVSSEWGTNLYSDDELKEVIQYTGTFNEIITSYPSKYVCKFDDYYRIGYYGEMNVAVLLFDSSGKRLFGKIYSLENEKTAFEELQLGQSLSDVQAISPEGEYLFLYTGRNDMPRVSTHYTTDHYLITVSYDESNLVANITIQSMCETGNYSLP
jgi:hypothetical protein